MKIESPKKLFPSLGLCIYCGDKSSKLTDEHIIPLGLSGNWIFDDASCMKCAKVINTFEQRCMRGMLNNARTKLGIESRHGDRPTIYKTYAITKDRKQIRVTLDLSELPYSMYMHCFDQPGILAGGPPLEAFHAREWRALSKQEMDKFLEKKGWLGIAHSEFSPFPFARLIAKIGHSYAIATYGCDKFVPILTDVILKDIKTPSYYVGGYLDAPARDIDALHWVRFKLNSGLLVAEVRLFACLGTPVYQAIVGVWHASTNQFIVEK